MRIQQAGNRRRLRGEHSMTGLLQQNYITKKANQAWQAPDVSQVNLG